MVFTVLLIEAGVAVVVATTLAMWARRNFALRPGRRRTSSN
jgi:hypothetical protein